MERGACFEFDLEERGLSEKGGLSGGSPRPHALSATKGLRRLMAESQF